MSSPPRSHAAADALGAVRSCGAVGSVKHWRRNLPARVTCAESAHATVELTVLTEGRASFDVGKSRLDAGAGDVLLIPAGVAHRSTLDGRLEAVSLHLAPAWLEPLAEAVGTRRLQPIVSPRHGTALNLARLLLDSLQDSERGAALEREALAEALAIATLRTGLLPLTGTRRMPPAIRRTLALFEAEYASPLRMDDVAARVGLSRFQLARAFREACGQSPYDALLALRLERAAAMLARGTRRITDVAFSVGIDDVSRFARHFRRHYGMLPSVWRQRAQQGADLPRSGRTEPVQRDVTGLS